MGGEDNKMLLRPRPGSQPGHDYICSMNVNEELVDKFAQLSRLQFNTEEKEKIMSDLQRMISFVEKLSDLDTTGIEPLRHLHSGSHMLREDNTGDILTREQALANARKNDGTYFKVPKVIRK